MTDDIADALRATTESIRTAIDAVKWLPESDDKIAVEIALERAKEKAATAEELFTQNRSDDDEPELPEYKRDSNNDLDREELEPEFE